MSKLSKLICAAFFLAVCLLSGPVLVHAQYLEAAITLDPGSAKAKVSGKWIAQRPSRRNFSFLQSAIGAPDLGRRISNVALSDPAGAVVASKAFNPSEYIAENEFSRFSYEVDLSPLPDARSAAHASWIGLEEGILFLDDLLPRPGPSDGKAVTLAISLPADWQVVGAPAAERGGVDRIDDVERAVFVLGKGLRSVAVPSEKPGLRLVLSGRWLFGDSEAAGAAAEIGDQYAKIFGGPVGTGDALIVLFPLPQTGVGKGTWEAESRGSTVVVTSSDMPFKTQSVQRLHEQLRHEMFHLWLPNGINLTGEYAWFYEGFALYQSLRTGVALNRIRFEDLLDTLSRAATIDRAQDPRRSLIGASRARWSGSETVLYARGMVMAFLCDLVLLQASNGKTSVESLLRRLYERHKFPAPPADGNTAVLEMLDSEPGLRRLADEHIRGAKPIDWSGIIASAGLEDETGTSVSVLRIKAKPTAKQKAVLDKLGYNNWRKLTRK